MQNLVCSVDSGYIEMKNSGRFDHKPDVFVEIRMMDDGDTVGQTFVEKRSWHPQWHDTKDM